jgi:NTP pyrophosphatase (non-canonical NTP hydrolase)
MTRSDARIVSKAIHEEAEAAREKYGDFTSTHEAYGVLAEEVAELLDAIRSNKRFSVQREAMQVAAVATRLAQQLEGAGEGFLARSGMA